MNALTIVRETTRYTIIRFAWTTTGNFNVTRRATRFAKVINDFCFEECKTRCMRRNKRNACNAEFLQSSSFRDGSVNAITVCASRTRASSRRAPYFAPFLFITLIRIRSTRVALPAGKRARSRRRSLFARLLSRAAAAAAAATQQPRPAI